MPIMISEDKTSGNIAIIEDIFRNQLNLPHDYFESRHDEPAPAIGIGGDNKTGNRIWSAKYNAGDNISAFDRLGFAQVIPGLFHAEMHAVHATYSQPDQRVTFRLLFGLYSWLFFSTRSPSTVSAEIHIYVYFPRAISRRFSGVLVSPMTTKGTQFP